MKCILKVSIRHNGQKMRFISQHAQLTPFNFMCAVLLVLLTQNYAQFGSTETSAFHLIHHSNSVNDYTMPTLVLYANGVS